MSTCRGCFGEFILAMGMLAGGAFFVWARATQPLEQFGTIEHIGRDGTVKSNPICLYGMIILTAIGIVFAASRLWRAEKGVIEAGAAAERQGGDPLPGVTKAAKTGCGTALAMLAVLSVCGLLATLLSLVARGA